MDAFFGKFKWFLKKIILLLKHPIILLTTKFDFSFVYNEMKILIFIA